MKRISATLSVGLVLGLAWIFGATSPLLARASAGAHEIELTLDAAEPVAPPPSADEWQARYEALPGPAVVEKSFSGGIPTFSSSIGVGRKHYAFTIVGSDPSHANAQPVSVPMVIIPVILKFADGTTFDPTVASACSGGSAPLATLLASPVIQNVDYGDGPRQYVEQFMRDEFWSFVSTISPAYSVRVSPVVGPKLIVGVSPTFTTKAAPCGRLGLIDKGTWVAFLKTKVFPQLASAGVSPRVFPFFLATDVVLYDGVQTKCCTLGFHSWFSVGGKQTYGVGDFDTSGTFANIADVTTFSHELSEFMNDPYVANPTPPWGHTGQVHGCQNNLEVGDPLSGTIQPVTLNGVTYHPQELAFFSWFYESRPSLGVNGWYSSNGTFTTPAAPCH